MAIESTRSNLLCENTEVPFMPAVSTNSNRWFGKRSSVTG